MQITLPKWYDLHAHFRQEDLIAPTIKAHAGMGCAGILAMPNTRPPVSKVDANDPGAGWSIAEYLEMLNDGGADQFTDVIVPLYLTSDTTPDMIERGAKSGVLRACKYYPPHGTTGADSAAPFSHYLENGVFEAMAEHGVVLCVHGEEHDMDTPAYFDQHMNAEKHFYQERLPRLLDHVPDIKLVCEHVTTKTAVGFVEDAGNNVGATVTPQHLLYTVGDLLKGLKYHLYCLPLLKFEEDLLALRAAVTADDNHKFFAGTDSAPHTHKVTECGCAAGCYTGGIAPQLYAMAFEQTGMNFLDQQVQDVFCNFLCLNGPAFYGLEAATETFTLERQPQEISATQIGENTLVPLPLGLMATESGHATLPWRITL